MKNDEEIQSKMFCFAQPNFELFPNRKFPEELSVMWQTLPTLNQSFTCIGEIFQPDIAVGLCSAPKMH